MEVTLIKNENDDDQALKEDGSTENSEETAILENITQLENMGPEPASFVINGLQDMPNANENLQLNNKDGHIQYTYIIENSDDFEEGTEFELAEGEHFIIEEFQGDYNEDQEVEYETVYINQVDSSPEEEDEETTEVYTITQEDQHEFMEEEVVSEAEVPLADEKTHIHTILQKEQLQVQIRKPSENTGREQHKENRVKEEIIGEHEYDSDSIEIVNLPEHPSHSAKPNDTHVDLLFKCSICEKEFKTSAGVKRHISVSHVKPEAMQKDNNDELSFSLCPCCGEPSDSAHTTGDYQCDQCDKLFLQKNSLDRHISIEHPIGNEYSCYECKKNFPTKEKIIEHSRIHSLKSVKCDDCGKEFARKYHLDRHIVHTGCMGVPKQVYDCRVCGKTFARKDNLAEHLKIHAGISITNKRKKKFSCEFCQKDFNGMALLNIHIRTHTGERPFGCDICEKRFPSSGAMKKHRRMHTGERPYACRQCGKRFTAKETLNRHWRTHTGEKPHKCKFCGKAFIQAAQLRAHIFHHTGENAYTCPHCNRAFNRRLRLTTHIKFMHEGAEPLKCTAEGCVKVFFRNDDLQRHLMTHLDKKPHACDICGKAFAVKSSLRTHKLTHKKEAPVRCEVCNGSFIRQDCLMRHMRSRHRDVLEDIVAAAEKKRLQQQLFRALANSEREDVENTEIWSEFTLTESIKELLSLLVDENCLHDLGHPEAPVDKVLESVIKRCGHVPASDTDFDYIGRLRENAKLLFTAVIDDEPVKKLLNNQTVDDVIMHVLKLAKKQQLNHEAEDAAVELEEMDEKFQLNSIENDEDNDYKDYDEAYVDSPDIVQEDDSEYILPDNIEQHSDDNAEIQGDNEDINEEEEVVLNDN